MERRSLNLPLALLGIAMAVAAALILVLATDLTYFGDTWNILMSRREFGVDALLEPHNEHIVLFPVLITQVLLRVFGMTSPMPEFVVLVIGQLAAAGLLFEYVRRRVGPWLALFAAVLLLFLGPAWEVLLWPFEIGYVGAVVFGLAALLALEREDRRGDIAACAFLALGLGFSTLGVPFAIGAAVAIGLGPRRRWLSRAYVIALPALLFLLWYAGWGHEAESHISLDNVLDSPRFVAELAAYSVSAVSGLGSSPLNGGPDVFWGRALLVALVLGFGAWFAWRRPGVPRSLWPVVAIAASSWFLTAFNAFAGREPFASRYQYAGGVLVLMILANLLSGVRIRGRGLVVAGLLTALILVPNVIVLRDGKRWFYQYTVLTRADTAAIEIARETVAPEFSLTPEIAGTPTLVDVNAASYLSAVDEYGSPAYSEAELVSAPESGRLQADVVLAQALPLATATEFGQPAAGAGARCVRLSPGGEPREVELGPGTHTIEVAPGGRANLNLRRFAVGQSPVPITAVPGGSVTRLTIPADASPRPWYLSAEPRRPVRVCG